ncbi:FAD-binding protein [Alkalilimnicola ehrlichii]|uniref:FAD-binding protein n=1 Tax=Alkalilimnicola ehrlichii TaxID=351052 RepID=UPI000E2F074A|nr:FAD-binding protein [Alkalilimnicola ehrlichii]
MSDVQYDIVIQGAGMAGLLLAAALIPSDLKVAVVEAQKPQRWREKPNQACGFRRLRLPPSVCCGRSVVGRRCRVGG